MTKKNFVLLVCLIIIAISPIYSQEKKFSVGGGSIFANDFVGGYMDFGFMFTSFDNGNLSSVVNENFFFGAISIGSRFYF